MTTAGTLSINLSDKVVMFRVRGGRWGFTLLDSLLVILILGIVSMVVMPQFHAIIAEEKLNGATGELVSGIEYARNLAVKYQRPFGVIADTEENWFRVFDDQYRDDPAPHTGEDPPVDAYGVVLEPFDKQWYLKDFDSTDTYVEVGIVTGGETLFYPDGHSGDADSTYVISAAGEQRTITVDGITGRVSVQ